MSQKWGFIFTIFGQKWRGCLCPPRAIFCLGENGSPFPGQKWSKMTKILVIFGWEKTTHFPLGKMALFSAERGLFPKMGDFWRPKIQKFKKFLGFWPNFQKFLVKFLKIWPFLGKFFGTFIKLIKSIIKCTLERRLTRRLFWKNRLIRRFFLKNWPKMAFSVQFWGQNWTQIGSI